MILAFLVDQTQQLCCALFQAVWAKLGSKRLLWERMRALFYDYRLDSMRALFEALFYGFEKSRPLLISIPLKLHRSPDVSVGKTADPSAARASSIQSTSCGASPRLSGPWSSSYNRHMIPLEV